MSKLRSWLMTLGLGAGLMYFYDPDQGRRRRAMIRDQADSLKSRSDDAIEKTARDLQNRTRGWLAEARAVVSRQEASDWVVSERARSKIGFLTSHPGSIEVDVQDGTAVLSGPILAGEVDKLVSGVSKVAGIRNVENNLQVFDNPQDIPGLQGRAQPRGAKPDLMQENWSPTTRLLTGLGAGTLMLAGKGRKGLIGTAFSLAGIGMAFRAVTNMPLTRVFGISDRRRVIDINKSIEVDVPIEDAYRLWSNFENFPKFMAHVKEIKSLGGERSQWVVSGPAGIPVEFNAVMTENIPNEVISWETEPDSMVKHRGHVKFMPGAEQQTQINVHLVYNPPAGVIGHAVAAIFGTDPKSAMDEDLVRLKSLLEVGKTTAEGKEVSRDDI